MEIAIQPHELTAAAAALNSCARDLEAGVAAFLRPAQRDAMELGFKSVVAADQGIVLTQRAVHALSADLDRLADALRTLATAYPAVDDSALAAR